MLLTDTKYNYYKRVLMKSEILKEQFYYNGEKIKIISGAVHYFRNMPDTWVDIFEKLRALGCNCVETYCAWNMHEKQPGEFNFKGILDIAEFVKKAAEVGLMVIFKPYVSYIEEVVKMIRIKQRKE